MSSRFARIGSPSGALLAERRELERNLHDGAQQRLVALALDLKLVQPRIEDHPRAAARLLAGAREELALAIEELRQLSRGLHPPVLTSRGLRAALEGLAKRPPCRYGSRHRSPGGSRNRWRRPPTTSWPRP